MASSKRKNFSVVGIIPHLYRPESRTLLLNSAIQSIIEAFKQSDYIDGSIIVYINNFPPQQNKTVFEKSFKVPNYTIEFLYSSINKGFTGAVNDAVMYALARYCPNWYLVLNDDAQVTTKIFRQLNNVLKTKKYKIISGVVVNSEGEVESTGTTYYPTGLSFPTKNNPPDEIMPLFCGTCFFISDTLVQKRIRSIGYLLNPLYFAYYEDLELSLWTQQHFLSSIYLSQQVIAVHQGSRTAIRGSEFQLFLGFRNAISTALIHWPVEKIILNLPFLLLGQAYMILLSWYKGYFLLYPKIVRYILCHRKEIFFLRTRMSHE
ncbi:MAG: glycosyltransferase [bacterium]|nr:glycosyltransferase [bacterium]